jgi:hypothetical protein
MRIFVTGGTGFIGTQLIKRLIADGHEVHALGRSEGSRETVRLLGATPIVGSLADIDLWKESLRGCDAGSLTSESHQSKDVWRLSSITGENGPSRVIPRPKAVGDLLHKISICNSGQSRVIPRPKAVGDLLHKISICNSGQYLAVGCSNLFFK